jgi:hypothetical protein
MKEVTRGSWKSTTFFSRPSESHRVTPTRSPSTSVSRYSEVKVESSPTAVAGGEGVLGRFFLDSARAVRRKSMKEDLPQLLVPMTRMLCSVSRASSAVRWQTYLKGVGSFRLLTRRGLLTVLIWLLA